MKTPPDEQTLFAEALRRMAGKSRDDYLATACGSDVELRQRVASLVRASEAAGAFLKIPVAIRSALDRSDLLSDQSDKAGERIDRYKLLEKIGEGGCGVVYMAEQEEPVRRRVALKILKLGMDTRSVVARFEAERQALAMMEHPNIAKVLDGGATQTGRPYFVMELVRGVRITDFCNQAGLSTVGRLRLFIQVCQAVQHAHQKGIIHRDLKPSNILVTVNDDLAVPKVIDFGIAKATGERLTDKTLFTQFRSFIGTPAYASPEQAEMSSVDIDTRSDIYSLGVLLYELLTGRTPFDAEELLKAGLDEMRRVIRDDEPPCPSTTLNSLGVEEISALTTGINGGVLRDIAQEKRRLVEVVEGDLDWIVMKCLEKDRARRYPTANGLAMDIQRHLAHEPIEARPVNARERLQRWTLRHPTVAVLSASVLLLLVVVAVGSTLAAWRVRSARDAEFSQRMEAEAANRKLLSANSQLAKTVSLLKFQGAEEQFRRQDGAAGVEQLASILHNDPNNEIAASRLVSALLHRNWALPQTPPLQHADRVTNCRFRPDGRQVLSTSWDKTAKIWDEPTGRLIATLQHEDKVLAGAYSPDGTRIVTASADGSARIWNATNGLQFHLLAHGKRTVLYAEFSPNSETVLTVCAGDETVRIWNAMTGALLAKLGEPGGGVLQARFSPNGAQIAIGTESGSVSIWEPASRRPVLHTGGHGDAVKALDFSVNGTTLMSASGDGTVLFWNTRTGAAAGLPLRHPDMLFHAALSPDGTTALTTSINNTARLWNVANGHLMHELTHEGNVIFGTFSPDGKIVLTTSMDNSARLWVVSTGLPYCQPLREPEAILHAAFSPSGDKVITASWASVAQVWDVEPRRSLGITLRHGNAVSAVAFAPDGLSVLSAADDTVRLWDAITGAEKCKPMVHPSAVQMAAFSSDGRRMVTTSQEGSAYVWETRTGTLVAGPLRHSKKIWFAEFNHDQTKIATASGDGTAQLWDASTGEPLGPPMEHGACVNSVRFSPDDRWVVTASENNAARVWNVQTSKPATGLLKHADHVEWADFSPDGLKVVSASSDNKAQIWDARTGQPIGHALEHARTVQKAVFSPNGKFVATGSLDCSARIWDAATGLPVTDPLLHERALFEVSFSVDSRRLLTSCPAGKSRIWDVQTGCPLMEWIEAGGFGFMSRFDQTGQRIVSGNGDGLIRIWDFPGVPIPVPSWFIRLAEAAAGRREDATGTRELVPRDEMRQIQDVLARSESKDFYARVGRWFLADPGYRAVSPY